ncbi:flagellar protein FlgN [Bacillus sp. FJAT-49736]|uniref:flagellar protein FlgN n=1 Tax=Bacillus sp. FJAT-49736 TaxID=2833582 RepID=UPI001BC9E804|nr:flagellar protein FlgN [Bacillus sp. FJAT-49736]MBS4174165.1 flagellar protein FlgN [Bacillus sp. FJAT-49736]
MSEPIITVLEKLYKLHESLYKLSLDKATIIKENDMEKLQQMLKDEQSHVAAINTLEVERQKLAKQLLGTDKDVTISECIEAAPSEMKGKLISLQTKISDIVEKLKDQNELNQSLIYLSLQYVNMTLDMLQPKPESFTYGRPNQQKSPKKPSFTAFDSKA